MFNEIYRYRNVLITGATGFKGSWLTFWLKRLGARVTGYSLPPPTEPNHYSLLRLGDDYIAGDIRDLDKLKLAMQQCQPEVVFHLAAQPLVRRSYAEPLDTFATNVMGTANVLEVCRGCGSVRAVIVITTDKCYENREWLWGYRECDPLGGYDPYSASKAAAEMVTASWRQSYFNPDSYGSKHQVLVASARAGNVIGGGDWAEDRLVPDIMKAAAADRVSLLRNPVAVRPWQHVLEPLCGYLMLGEKLLSGKREFAAAWNFGPDEQSAITVEDAALQLQRNWPRIKLESLAVDQAAVHEAGLLKLDSSRARTLLGWHPRWDAGRTFAVTAAWYKDYYEGGRINTEADLAAYEETF